MITVLDALQRAHGELPPVKSVQILTTQAKHPDCLPLHVVLEDDKAFGGYTFSKSVSLAVSVSNSGHWQEVAMPTLYGPVIDIQDRDAKAFHGLFSRQYDAIVDAYESRQAEDAE